jgi:hypothetical protein
MNLDKLTGAMVETLSLAQVPPAERPARVQRARDELRARARERFPESEGYEHATTERLATWAWPKGAESEAQARKYLDRETQALAVRESLTIRRGMTWGLTLDVQTTDRAQSALKLTAVIESKLMAVLTVGGFVLCIAAGVGLALLQGLGAAKGVRVRSLVMGGFFGMLAGLPVAFVLFKLSKPLGRMIGDPLSDEEGRRHFDELREQVRSKL